MDDKKLDVMSLVKDEYIVETAPKAFFNSKKLRAKRYMKLVACVAIIATQITGNILFHSVPYTEKYNNASLEYWEYDKLGTSASLGCIRLTVKNAKWIYDN